MRRRFGVNCFPSSPLLLLQSIFYAIFSTACINAWIKCITADCPFCQFQFNHSHQQLWAINNGKSKRVCCCPYTFHVFHNTAYLKCKLRESRRWRWCVSSSPNSNQSTTILIFGFSTSFPQITNIAGFDDDDDGHLCVFVCFSAHCCRRLQPRHNCCRWANYFFASLSPHHLLDDISGQPTCANDNNISLEDDSDM